MFLIKKRVQDKKEEHFAYLDCHFLYMFYSFDFCSFNQQAVDPSQQRYYTTTVDSGKNGAPARSKSGRSTNGGSMVGRESEINDDDDRSHESYRIPDSPDAFRKPKK